MGAAPRIRRMVRLTAPALGLLLCTGCSDLLGGGRAQDWLAWTIPHGSSHAALAPVGGLLLVEAGPGVVALRQSDGSEAYRTTLDRTSASSRIWVQGDRAYFTPGEDVYAVEAATGAVFWHAALPSSADYSHNTADERAVYVGMRNRRVVALSAADGAQLWEVDVGLGWVFASLITGISVAGDTVYVAVRRHMDDGDLLQRAVVVALDRHSGREIWRYEGGGPHANVIDAPTVAGDFLVLSDEYTNTFFALDRATGREAWRVQGLRGYVGPYNRPRVADGVVYAGMGDTHVWAADLRTGKVLWKTATGSSIYAVEVCGERIVVNDDDIEILDRRTGRHLGYALRSTDAVFATSDVVVSGMRAFVIGNKASYAIDCG